MTKVVKTAIMAGVLAVALQPTDMCAVNSQSSSRFWKFGLIGAAALGFTYLLNRFTPIPLQSAVALNCNTIAKLLVHCGADVNMSWGIDGGDWPLRIAASSGNLYMVKFLVEHGADVNSGEESCLGSELWNASYRGHRDVVEYLIKNGAEVYCNVLEEVHKGALSGGMLNIVKLTIENCKKNNFYNVVDRVDSFYSRNSYVKPADVKAYQALANDFYNVTITAMKFEDFAKKHLKQNDKKQVENNCADVSKLLHFAPNNVAKEYNKWLDNNLGYKSLRSKSV